MNTDLLLKLRSRLVLVAVLVGFLHSPVIRAQTGPQCSGNSVLLEQSFVNGARWRLCWQVETHSGLRFEQLHFTTATGDERSVLASLALAKVQTDFANGGSPLDFVLDPGLGSSLADLSVAECSSGTLQMWQGEPRMCARVFDRGYSYKYYSVFKLGQALELLFVAEVGERALLVSLRLFDDGTIEPVLGHGGRLTEFVLDASLGWPVDATNAALASGLSWVWRIEFLLGTTQTDDSLEEFEVHAVDSTHETTVTARGSEVALIVDSELKRSWRAVDGGYMNVDGNFASYHLEPLEIGQRVETSGGWSQNDLYVTVPRACERLVTGNPTAGGCAGGLTGFVNGESLSGAGLVFWYRQSLRVLPRDEDDVALPLRWQGFQLVPRDWTVKNQDASTRYQNRPMRTER